jgi:hypothetical protein
VVAELSATLRQPEFAKSEKGAATA